MSKAHMIVLSFLNRKPMYGYQIGQKVEQQRIPSWSGVRLAAIYKSMQSLEKLRHIHGEEQREGNNPPRTVYKITARGQEYLRQMIIKALEDVESFPTDWWMTLALARHSVTKAEMLAIIEKRLAHLREVVLKKCEVDKHFGDMPDDERPFMHKEAIELGRVWIRDEITVLSDLHEAIAEGRYDTQFTHPGGLA